MLNQSAALSLPAGLAYPLYRKGWLPRGVVRFLTTKLDQGTRMKRIASTACAAILLMLGSAHAQQMPPMTMSAVYGELGYTLMNIDAFGTTFHPGAIRGILGFDASPYFAIEGMLAGGFNNDDNSTTINGRPVSTETK